MFLSLSKLKSEAGVTITELVVATTIIAILTSIVLINYQGIGQELTLQRAAYKLTQDIRRAGEMAMASQKCCGGIVPPGYGIYLDKSASSTYLLYADTNLGTGEEKYEPSDTIIEPNIPLEKGVMIKNVSSTNGKISINFKPPSPKITLWATPDDPTRTSITITLISGNRTKIVQVNAAGLIEIQ